MCDALARLRGKEEGLSGEPGGSRKEPLQNGVKRLIALHHRRRDVSTGNNPTVMRTLRKRTWRRRRISTLGKKGGLKLKGPIGAGAALISDRLAKALTFTPAPAQPCTRFPDACAAYISINVCVCVLLN